jgi:hypothetical protein
VRSLTKPEQGGALVRVLAVAQGLGAAQGQRFAIRAGRVRAGQVVADRAVVGGGVGEGLQRQHLAGLNRYKAVLMEVAQDQLVIVRIAHHGDPGVVFRRGPDQGHPADVDVFDRVGEGDIRLGDRLLEGIQVDNHQVDHRRAHPGQVGPVRISVSGQNTGVDGRVQGLDPPLEDLR